MKHLYKKTDGFYPLLRQYRRPIRFCLVGAVNTIIDLVTFSVCIYFLGVNPAIGQIAGYSAGTVNSFILNKRWTFHSDTPSRKTGYQLLRFIVINLLSLGITAWGLTFLTDSLRANVYFSKLLITAAAQTVNFAGYKLIVFKPRENLYDHRVSD